MRLITSFPTEFADEKVMQPLRIYSPEVGPRCIFRYGLDILSNHVTWSVDHLIRHWIFG